MSCDEEISMAICDQNEETNDTNFREMNGWATTEAGARAPIYKKVPEDQSVTRIIKCDQLTCNGDNVECQISITKNNITTQIDRHIKCTMSLSSSGVVSWHCHYLTIQAVRITTFCTCVSSPV